MEARLADTLRGHADRGQRLERARTLISLGHRCNFSLGHLWQRSILRGVPGFTCASTRWRLILRLVAFSRDRRVAKTWQTKVLAGRVNKVDVLHRCLCNILLIVQLSNQRRRQ